MLISISCDKLPYIFTSVPLAAAKLGPVDVMIDGNNFFLKVRGSGNMSESVWMRNSSPVMRSPANKRWLLVAWEVLAATSERPSFSFLMMNEHILCTLECICGPLHHKACGQRCQTYGFRSISEVMISRIILVTFCGGKQRHWYNFYVLVSENNFGNFEPVIWLPHKKQREIYLPIVRHF